ncbi:hypothetical protein FRB96_008369 [Tulasnella sp. 330]|nr:hypothetical protein FRB96_008369 [Tulasnella sp. 330]KAG8884752.1 hypothetical protein FRB97_003272 [Tulasnella sp. 331]
MANMNEMSVSTTDETVQATFVVPEVTVKDLLSAIPPHCFERSFFRSSLYLVGDFVAISALLWTAQTYIPFIDPRYISLPHPVLYGAARLAAWGAYTFGAGLLFMGLFVVGHEAGHGAYSTSKTANNIVGLLVHSFIGVPYHAWRISHAKHHAQTSHLTADQAFVPNTREDWGLPPLDTEKENLEGTAVSSDLAEVFEEVLEYSPFRSIYWLFIQLFFGWPAYLIMNAKGQKNYPPWTNHFMPRGPIFAPHQYRDIIISDIGVGIWFVALVFAIAHFGFVAVFRTYIMPWFWYGHWLVFITYQQHTDPALPHYAATSFTFPRGALSTFDRELMGGPGIFGKICNYICATATHGICETHVAHHVCSKIPHYHAWAAKAALDKRLHEEGIFLQGRPATWTEAYRIFNECKFIESEGEVRFYKNAKGKAARVAVFASDSIVDSGVEL